jgi:hypothetical protein
MNGIVHGFRYSPGWCGSTGITDPGDPPDAVDECDAGGDHEWETFQESYGEDRDGNRGIWVSYEGCRKCRTRRDEL